jgi:hypothetical protein
MIKSHATRHTPSSLASSCKIQPKAIRYSWEHTVTHKTHCPCWPTSRPRAAAFAAATAWCLQWPNNGQLVCMYRACQFIQYNTKSRPAVPDHANIADRHGSFSLCDLTTITPLADVIQTRMSILHHTACAHSNMPQVSGRAAPSFTLPCTPCQGLPLSTPGHDRSYCDTQVVQTSAPAFSAGGWAPRCTCK